MENMFIYLEFLSHRRHSVLSFLPVETIRSHPGMGNHTAATLGPPFGPVDGNGTIIVVFWEYKPNQSAAYAFVALFALTTICQFLYLFMLRPRPWYFIPFILGGIGKTSFSWHRTGDF